MPVWENCFIIRGNTVNLRWHLSLRSPSFFENKSRSDIKNEMRIHLTEDFPLEKIPNGKDYPWARGNHEVLFYEYEGIYYLGTDGEASVL